MIDLGKINEMEHAHQVLFDMIEDKNAVEQRELVVDGYFYQYDVLK